MSFSEEDLARLEALAEAATLRGSWQPGRAGSCNVVDYDGDDIVGVAVVPDEANAVFIAASRTAVPALIAALRECQRALLAERARTERLVGLLREASPSVSVDYTYSLNFGNQAAAQDALDLLNRIDAELAKGGE